MDSSLGMAAELDSGFDIWCADCDLAFLFPKLFQLAAIKEAKVLPHVHEDKLFNPSGVNVPGLPNHWFWRMPVGL